jgi:membrane protease YdiL (CAAX protease family)
MTSKPSRVGEFFGLAFLFTWGLQAPGVLAHLGFISGEPTRFLPLAGLGIFGPMLAALVVTRREGGTRSELLGPLLRWRVHPGWYLVALLPAALLALVLFLLNLAGRHGPIAYVPTLGGLVFGIVISISEEIGWRGFALPRLEERFGGFAASGLLGTLWCLWHVPMFLGLDVPLTLLPVMLLYFVGASLLLTWIYDGTGGSLLLASVAHLAAHLNNSHRALPQEVLPLVAHGIVYAAFGVLVMRGTLPRARGLVRQPPTTP